MGFKASIQQINRYVDSGSRVQDSDTNALVIESTNSTEPTKPTKPQKRDRPFGTESRDPTRRPGLQRAGPRAVPVSPPPVIQPSRRSRREGAGRLYREEILPELRRQAPAEEEYKEEERPEDVMRAKDENGFVDLSQLPSQEPAPRNDTAAPTTRNRTSHRGGKSLGDQHMAARNPQKRPLESKLEPLHSEEHRSPHCRAYQYDNECHEVKRRPKY